MNDCPNADVRDLLPDLLHGRLDAIARMAVKAHVADCADCTAELALLRDLRLVRRTPALDRNAIIAAVPAYRAAPRRSWVGWRAAAAITVLVVGASSVAVLQRGVSPARSHTAGSTMVPTTAAVSSPSRPVTVAITPGNPVAEKRPITTMPIAPAPTSVASATASAPGERELAMAGGSLGDLDDRQLASLLKDIESLDAVPSIEVGYTPLSPIAPSSTSQASP
ncbi:MAG: zf-HC2 domain-containing protein [Gemmatimonadota bacterium]|nr:zf-HC2 domain-containing protein [Gemmatimonadota bacterium]